jgi:hypothetical protein
MLFGRIRGEVLASLPRQWEGDSSGYLTLRQLTLTARWFLVASSDM